MKINYLMKYTVVLLIICMTNISCYYKKNISNIIGEKNLNNLEKYIENKNFFREKKILKAQKLKNMNIIYFDLDQYQVLQESIDILTQHIHFLHKNPNHNIIIEGHTDERGTPEYNIALGERRANAIKIYLQSHGIVANRILTISYGKEKPICLGHNEKDYEKNRRAVLTYN